MILRILPAVPMLRIEVVLCTFNGASFIEEQIDSILRQTAPVDVISIFDDRSQDETVSVIRQMIEKQRNKPPEIRLHINDRNLGFANNFSTALSSSIGDVIFLCDQDDVWREDKVSVLMALMERENVGLVFSDGNLIDDQGARLSPATVLGSYGLGPAEICAFGNDPVRFLVRRNFVNGAAMAIRRTVALSALPVPPIIPHDYWLAVWSSLHHGVAATTETLYDYRQHSRNVIGVGIHHIHHQWIGIWKRPSPPRMRELAIVESIVSRTMADTKSKAFEEKLSWMRSCLVAGSRYSRLASILKSLISGKYRRFGVSYALVRDILTALR